MIKISIISNDPEQVINLQSLLKMHYFVCGNFKNVDHIVTKKNKSSQTSLILFCNNEYDDIKKLIKEFKKTNIIIFNDLENDLLLFNAMQLGIKSYVHSSQKVNELMNIIEIVSTKGSYVSSFITNKLFDYIKSITDYMLGKNIDRYNALSQREIIVFELLLNGNSYKFIAESLNISVNTISKHITSIYKKLDIHSKGELYNLHYNIGTNSKQYNQLFLHQTNH